VWDLVFHGCALDWKLVRSGQVRTYWRSRCSGCGWVAKGYRVTEDRAEADHAAHVAAVERS
jgi:hypothetical protein